MVAKCGTELLYVTFPWLVEVVLASPLLPNGLSVDGTERGIGAKPSAA